MKHLFLITLLFSLAAAAPAAYTLKGHKGQSLRFSAGPETEKSRKSGAKETVFYRHGIASKAARVVTTGLLRVRLAEGTRPESFAKTHDLEYVRTIDRGLFLFKNLSTQNDMAQAARLAHDPAVLSALPRFKSRKSLK